MATINPYLLRADYVSDGPVSAADLNRRGRVLSAQLPGALRAACLSAGVLPLWSPDEDETDLILDLDAAATGALRVSQTGPLLSVAAGAATIRHPSGALVYVQTAGLSAPVPTETPAFVHLMLAQSVDPLAPGAVDSQTGSPPTLLVSDLESEAGGLLLASYQDGTLTDRRQFAAAVLLAREFIKLRQRLDALDAPIEDDGSGPTAAHFNELKARVDSQDVLLLALLARVVALESRDEDDFPSIEDQLADEIAINRAGLAEVNPHAIERGQISVVVVGAGHGQNDTPDYTPTTGADDELAFNAGDGTFGS